MKKITDLFLNQCALNPERVAVIDGDVDLSYKQIDELSEKVKVSLLSLVGENRIVGICLSERPSELIISILGTLKAGCTYVPLDPKNPADRLQYLLAEANPAIVITDKGTSDKILQTCDVIDYSNLLSYSRDSYSVTESVNNEIAYIIFTSGTTGKPKGVKVTHRNLIGVFNAWKIAYNLDSIKTHLQVAGFGFDVFAGDWLRSLCSGATLVMCTENVLLNPEELYKNIIKNRIECAEFLPSQLRTLATYLKENNLKIDTFKICICGSDRWFVSEYFEFKKFLAENARLINSYGTSETTIDTSYFEFFDDNIFLAKECHTVPIGKPFKGMELAIFNESHERITIPGIVGELYIGGVGVSEGYIGSGNLNNEKFEIIDSRRYYKTGDFGRLLSSMDIEIVGRSDGQVKFRGHRISLVEVEQAIMGSFTVRACVAFMDAEELVVVVESMSIYEEKFNQSLEVLAEKLPSFMIPSKFVVFEEIPLNINNKIDRNKTIEMYEQTK